MNKDLKQLLEDFKYYNGRGNSSRAKIVLDELKQKYPTDARVIFSEALYYYRLGTRQDGIKALNILKYLIDMDAKNKEASMYEYIRMISYMGIKSDEINEYYRYLVKNKYKTEYVYFYYGRYLEGQHQLDDAYKMYEISKKLGYRKAAERMSNLDYKKEIDKKKIEEVATHDNKNLFDLKLSMQKLFYECKYDEIRVMLNDFENKYGIMTNFMVMYFIFKSYIATGYLEDARNLYNNNSKYIKEDYLKLFLEARLDLCDEKYEDAITKFNKVISCNKEFLDSSYYYLAQLANLNKQYDLEREYYMRMKDISKNPDYACLKLIELDICEYKYEDAMNRLKLLSDKCINENDVDINRIKAIIDPDVSIDQSCFYSVNQIFDYADDATFNHIQKHVDGDNENSFFNQNIDLVKLIDEVRDMIIDKEVTYHDIFNHYIIDYPNIGYYRDRTVNYLEVIVIPHTNKIITMFPVASKNIFIPNKLEEKVVKVKRKSQIDKFYERYGK